MWAEVLAKDLSFLCKGDSIKAVYRFCSCVWLVLLALACREGGKPLLVSLLVYLDKEWPLGHDAETLFLDTPTDTGEFDQPLRYPSPPAMTQAGHLLAPPTGA